jgi:hypothetical protein
MAYELIEMKRVLELNPVGYGPSFRQVELGAVRGRIRGEQREYPLLGFVFGPNDPSLPTLGLFGGVHGLERVGTHVVLAFLESLVARLHWDERLHEDLKHARIVSIPLINPAGMAMNWRSNPQGIDLMRNSPVDAEIRTPWLVGGHRVGPWLPWYRGQKGAAMEPEVQAVEKFVRAEMFPSRTSIAIDFHSGFGFLDRLWYPFSKSRGDFPRMREIRELERMFLETHPYHAYKIEPQCDSYAIHGDLWDHLFLEHARSEHRENTFLPWTLEMGSWQWVRKNLRQLLKPRSGLFEPVKLHRYKRAMRRHMGMIEFFHRTLLNDRKWRQTGEV